jgi:integrase
MTKASRGLELLSARTVETAKPRETEYYLRDGGGLYVRVYPSGLRRAQYRFDDRDGRTRRVEHPLPLGKGDGALTLAQARAWRAELAALRLRGVDPVRAELDKREARSMAVAAKPANVRIKDAPAARPLDYRSGTFGAVAEEFYSRRIARVYEDPSQVRRILDIDLLPAIGLLPVATLRLSDVQAALNRIVDRGSPVAANRALLIAKRISQYARTQGYAEHNPLSDLTRRDVGGREGQRERVLDDAEIALFWRVLNGQHAVARPVACGTRNGQPTAGYVRHGLRMDWQARACLQLLLMTGQRIGETLLAQWHHVDLDAGTWSLPPENTKAKRAHLVHLGPLALELLRTLPGPRSGPGWIFHDGTPEGAAPIPRRTVTRALDRLQTGEHPALKIPHFTPHDLRRTMRTRMADLGIQPHVAEKVLAHRLGGVLQVYDRADYLPERKQAMAAWDSKLRTLLADPDGRVVFEPPA